MTDTELAIKMNTLVVIKPLGLLVSFIFLTTLIWTDSLSYGDEGRDLRRSSSEGSVTVEAVYLNPLLNESDAILQIELKINTHSENLEDYNPQDHAYLQIGNGMLHRAIGWAEQKRDTHHIEGVLQFAGPVPPISKHLELFIHDLGGVNKRTFKWLLTYLGK
ncbi:MAG: hypothetical protein JSV73_04520 [Flavobacteriaceae bacterium]|nr:MAG: hypothetical protein JSV73_04520 [Flavobacteriaceae bacterium]